MVFYLHLFDLWDYYTVKGKLHCGEMFGWGKIEIHERTYSNQFLKYQRLAIQQLYDLVDEIEQNIIEYKKKLKTT